MNQIGAIYISILFFLLCTLIGYFVGAIDAVGHTNGALGGLTVAVFFTILVLLRS